VKDGGMGKKIQNQLLPAKITPKLNKLVMFWSDCVPHEVLEISSNRLAFQVFYSKKD